MTLTIGVSRRPPSTPRPPRLAIGWLGALALLAVARPGDARDAVPRAARAPAPASSASSAQCPGLASYEIVRASTEQARCSAGNVVTGGSCSGIGGGPALDEAGWECAPGDRATAICAGLCSRAPEPEGACCEGTSCLIATPADCGSRGGSYRGDGTTCETDTCAPRGACCLSSGGSDTCLDDTTPSECSGQGGVYIGDDVTCDSDVACLACPNRPGCAP